MRKTLYQTIVDEYPVAVNDGDYECIEKEVSSYLLQGYSIQECIDAAKRFYNKFEYRYGDDPAACFSYGMGKYIEH